MYALVESGSITKIFTNPKGFVLNNNQYPADIFSKWTKDEKEAIGIYEVEMDNSKRKDEQWYINTNVTYAFGSGKVTGSYGDATAKAHADTLWTSQDKTDGKIPADKDVGDVKVEGLKTILIRNIKAQAAGILQETDWYVIRKADSGTAVPSAITTHRAAVRTKCASMETSITRPLGELPVLES